MNNINTDKPKDRNGLTEKEFLEAYRPKDYPRPSVATDMIIFTIERRNNLNYRKLSEQNLKILLIQRAGHPYINQWALPGGFVNPDETTEQAASRELEEETGVKNVYLEQLYTFSEPDRDPRMRVMSCSYMALVDFEKINVKAGDDASKAEWFDISYRQISSELSSDGTKQTSHYELILKQNENTLSAVIEKSRTISAGCSSDSYRIIENHGIAFDHARIIAYAMERLRGKIQYTDIALNLMPELFTLTELQKVYETILGKELLKPSFRRKIFAENIIEPTDEYCRSHGHRPPRLFRRKISFDDGWSYADNNKLNSEE